MTVIESIRLLCTENGSDKEYLAQIEANDDGTYSVIGHNGRRGGRLTPQQKAVGVDRAAADKAYNDLVSKKLKGGYRPDGAAVDANAAAITAKVVAADTGFRPQLLTAIERDDRAHVERLLEDNDFALLRKVDGERACVTKRGDVVTFANRKGQTMTVPPVLAESFAKIGGDFTIDGELMMGAFFYAFDLLDHRGNDLREFSFDERHATLRHILREEDESRKPAEGEICYLRAYTESAAKKAAAERFERTNCEGLVFRRRQSPYRPGRPGTAHGDARKYKFWNSLSAIVARDNGKNSIGLELVDAGGRVFVGNVTVKANQTKPPIGAVVEIKYLWMVNAGGSLYQPELLGVRGDIDPAECGVDQIVYKGADA